jgi:hypothetical protein
MIAWLFGQTNHMNEKVKYTELDPEVVNAARLDPEVTEVSQVVRQALLEIRIYNSSHKGDAPLGASYQSLVAAGALSPGTVARLANYQTQFHGSPIRIASDIPVLDVVLADRTPPLCFVGFADGHTQLVAVDKQT